MIISYYICNEIHLQVITTNVIIMEKLNELPIILPPKGWTEDLAKLAGCCKKTVYNAIRRNSNGKKADLIRELYRTKFLKTQNQ